MHRTILFFLLLLLVATTGKGQRPVKRALKADTGTLYLRFNPLGLMDMFDGNVSFGSEYRFNETWAATLDAGAILYSAYFDKTRRTTGLLLRPGIRVYPTRYKDFFVDFQFHYKNVTYRINDWIEKEVVSNVASYEERKVFQYKKQVMGGRVMIGMRNYFTGNARFYMEVYAGVGVHYKVEGLHNEPNSQYRRRFRILNDNGKFTVPAFPLGIRFVYLLR
jgi:hypothetical protein